MKDSIELSHPFPIPISTNGMKEGNSHPGFLVSLRRPGLSTGNYIRLPVATARLVIQAEKTFCIKAALFGRPGLKCRGKEEF